MTENRKIRKECYSCKQFCGTNIDNGVCGNGQDFTYVRKKNICNMYEKIYLSAVAYTDGSYNKKTMEYGYAAILVTEKAEFEYSGHGKMEHDGWQVEGEIAAVLKVCSEALKLGISALEIRYDYEGIAAWALGKWKTNKEYTFRYSQSMMHYMNQMHVTFKHIKSHTGDVGNERVDELAKKACGIYVGKQKNDFTPIIPDDVSYKCKESILRFYGKEKRLFSDFVQLRTYGRDRYSRLPFDKLQAYADEMNLNIDFKGDKKMYASCIRWIMRGLRPADAIRKVEIDAEVAAKLQSNYDNNIY